VKKITLDQVVLVNAKGEEIIIAPTSSSRLQPPKRNAEKETRSRTASPNRNPDGPKIYSRTEFEKAVVGRTEEEIIKAVGRPSETSEERAYSVDGLNFRIWTYRGATLNPITLKVDGQTKVKIAHIVESSRAGNMITKDEWRAEKVAYNFDSIR
jgi:hypothetical protein